MRKYFLATLLLTILSGCEKDFDEVIDASNENYQVSFVGGLKDSVDLKNPPDSLLELRLGFKSGSQINKVYFDIYASDNSLLNPSPVEMHSIGNNIFTNQFILKKNYPVGNYNVKFNVTGFDGVNNLVAIGYFFFNNGQDNVAPVISNLVLPGIVARGVSFIFNVAVSDSNGLNDVNFVYFELFRPDGTAVEENPGDNIFSMHDDGNTEIFGDETASDGIYSFKNLFGQTAQTGSWRFVFRSVDRSGLLSNIIEQFLIVE